MAGVNDGNEGIEGSAIMMEMIQDGVLTDYVHPNSRIMKASSCFVDAKPAPKFSVQKVLKGVMLSIKHGSTSKTGGTKGWISGQFMQGNIKRQKVERNFNYNRLAIFGDLAQPPTCFAVLCESEEESRTVYRECMDKIAVGTAFYIVEPRVCDKFLGGGNIPIIMTRHAILPLKMSTAEVTLEQNYPSFPMRFQQSGGSQYFFVQHNVEVLIGYFQLLLTGSSCTGRLCDRAVNLQGKGGCSCFHTPNSRHDLVGEYDVSFPVPSNVSESQIETAQMCRSLRTTEGFFRDLHEFYKKPDADISQRYNEMKDRIDMIEDYVNNHGGWTLVGWYKRGEVEDAANPGEKVASLAWTFHVSLLVPTSAEIRNKEDAAYNALLIPTKP